MSPEQWASSTGYHWNNTVPNFNSLSGHWLGTGTRFQTAGEFRVHTNSDWCCSSSRLAGGGLSGCGLRDRGRGHTY